MPTVPPHSPRPIQKQELPVEGKGERNGAGVGQVREKLKKFLWFPDEETEWPQRA